MIIQSENAGVAELVDALDLGSSILGCESSSLSFRTTFLIRIKIISNFLVGISPSGKAPGFDPGIPRFKSWYPSQFLYYPVLFLISIFVYKLINVYWLAKIIPLQILVSGGH